MSAPPESDDEKNARKMEAMQPGVHFDPGVSAPSPLGGR
jgi:hypothetical protein